MAEESKSNINQEYNKAAVGLNLDGSQNNIKKGQLSYALNAGLENYDANSVQYQNEPGNEFCFDFPEGYKLVGKHFIPEQNKIIFMLTNPETGGSEIGYMVNNDCVYRTLVNADCLNFDIFRPILKMVHKVTNFGTELYWPDNNGRRYLNIDNIPWMPTNTSDVCDPEDSNRLDCNKLRLQPDINIPLVNVSDVISGGEITAGTVQFTVQYSDAAGNPYTPYYGVTNPTPIADVDLATVNFDYKVGKAVIVDIKNLDPLGQYQYFNLAVLKTINGITTPELVGTYFIDDISKQITYTGQVQTNIQLSINDIFERFTYYENADYVTAVQDILVWKGMTATPRLNYQKIANQIQLQWQTYRVPANESYANEEIATNLRGYLRDEVYAFEVVFLLDNGKETDGFHIPGRPKGFMELSFPDVPTDNPDFIGDPSLGPAPYWKVYNTASVEGTDPNYLPTEDYKGPYQYGNFAYWESTEEYPCDEEVWGELAGEKIRHHKMPDVLVSPIIESSEYGGALVSENVPFYPLGVKIDSEKVQEIIELSDLTKEQKEQIVGYKIIRGDRGVNKSIVAKGMLRNVGTYERNDQKFYYPNYPYNDLTADPFLNKINNAWTKLCEEWTVAVYEFPVQNEEGDRFIEISWRSCDNNKETGIKLTIDSPEWEIQGNAYILKICSITRPKFTSKGTFNEMFQPEANNDTSDQQWEDFQSVPEVGCQGIIFPSNYDVYRIDWRTKVPNAGMRPNWADYITTDGDYWLTWQNILFVKVLVGEVPSCADSSCFRERAPIVGGGQGKLKFQTRLIEEIRELNCTIETPLEPIKDDETLAYRQIFNSPETSFGQPFLGNILKLENVMYGAGKAHFVEVEKNAKYKLLTEEAQRDALLAGEYVGGITGEFSLDSMMSVYNSYLTIYVNGITRKNYAYSFNSIASYNYCEPIPNDLGIKQRNLDIKRYLIPSVLSVGETDNIIINNYQRETSVYLRTTEKTTPLPFPSETRTMEPIGVVDKSRFTISSEEIQNCDSPEKEEPISVVSYYGSLKNEFLNQYGQIYSYDTVDTGFVKLFSNLDLNPDFIFGGDTFIGRFAYKTKLPFFLDNRVNAPDDSDIFYDEIGNVAYPKYWHSSRSILETYRSPLRSGLNLTNFISYKATNFDCPNSQEVIPAGADPSTNPDRTFYDGYYYLFAYGVPSFYCESSYNLDLRTAFNDREGNFWPRVSTGIPDEWVQEKNVSILNDNTYNYNVTFSKQNKESVFTNLPADWGTGEDRIKYPFRAVYSDQQNTDADNRVNNWLTYRAVSYFDFPQNFGELVALDSLKNAAILARFENKSLLYNNLLTIDTSNPQAAYIGNSKLFSGSPPIDFAETDLGYVGCQNKMLLKIPQGALTVDAKRGQIFLINGTEIRDLTAYGSGMNRWFTAHLPFEILKHFPETEKIVDGEKVIVPGVDTDNHFNGVGLHGVYDSNYERVIITKLDYIPLYDSITFEDNRYFITEKDIKKEIYLTDSDYFCNVSWTLSFNFNTNSWVSFHSYLPNWYVGENNFFYSGLNYCPNDFDALVGVKDAEFPTTTTTTTKQYATTTSTTTQEVVPDCTFDVTLSIPECDLEGTAVFIGSEPTPECLRIANLTTVDLYIGYTLNTPAGVYDSTTSEAAACAAVYYYLNNRANPDGNYSPIIQQAEISGYSVGSYVYASNNTLDCTTVADGWYFTRGSAEDEYKAFYVENGRVNAVSDCNDEIVDVTTTTTTTSSAFVSWCFVGLYSTGDPINPLGGSIEYIDEYGVSQTITGIYDTDTININAISLISTIGVEVCPAVTTTTTTTASPTTTTTTTVI